MVNLSSLKLTIMIKYRDRQGRYTSYINIKYTIVIF